MLRTAPIRSKVIAILALPLAGLIALAATGIGSSLARGAEAHRVNDLAQLAVRGNTLVHELQAERTLSSGWVSARANRAAVPRDGMVTQRIVVDRTVAALGDFAAGLDADGYDPKLRQALDRALKELDGLAVYRRTIDTNSSPAFTADAVENAYSGTLSTLLDLNANIAVGTDDEALFRSVTAFVALSHVKDAIDLERGFQVSGLLGSDSGRQRFKRFISFVDQRETWLAQLKASATPDQFARYQRVASGPEVDRSVTIEQAALSGSTTELRAVGTGERLDRIWFAAMTERVAKLRRVEREFAADLVRTSRSVAASANRQTLLWLAGTVALLLVTALLSLFIARSLVNPLRKLQDAAEDVARRELPEAVERIQSLRDPDQADVAIRGQASPFDASAQDEISRVARSFNAVHEVAIKVAAEQAGLRRSIADTFQNLAQRTQDLVRGSMELVDELEQDETRPNTLDRLFRLDHLITRMRRNAENLIVLAGAELPTRWDEPVPLDVVIRSAVAEVQDYQRVQPLPMGELQVVGPVCVDVIHLFAELIENGTMFSAPGTKVTVAGLPITYGHVVEIEDQGVGMPDEELARANRELADPPAIDFALSRRIGLHVVARLAKRHGIRVQLRHSWYGGVAALVLLPNDILVRPPGTSALPEPGWPARHLAGQYAGRGGLAVLESPQAWSDQPVDQAHVPLRRHVGTDDLRLPRHEAARPGGPAPNGDADVDGAPSGEPVPGAGPPLRNGLPHRIPRAAPAPEPGSGPTRTAGLRAAGDATAPARPRDPRDVSRMLSSFRQGVERGRVAQGQQPDSPGSPDGAPQPPDQGSGLRWRSDDVAPPERPAP
ncbi:MAG TPA: nitrate- and nitrite sensing domain-containing protein [Actinomycetes bacterium]|nr:nitrate- and nitrite sensing domain-containing protein [Actinomycetes bacterium]